MSASEEGIDVRDLSEVEIIEMIRQEYDQKLRRLASEITTHLGGKKTFNGEPGINVIARGLKVRHHKSRYLYTVTGMFRDADQKLMIKLQTPEGDVFDVNEEEFEKNYESD
tara:strand:- start:340 stop:672 length:333 start_codon:yes stop_codon:yes gene_type:complete